ncbi:MAG TPA: DUF2141 domain-containing protein [Sphingobium sp.]
MSMSNLLLIAAAAIPQPGQPGYIPSSPDLGMAEGKCRPNESGPAYIISVTGLKDRKGMLRVELYPNNDKDFLADDNILVMEGKAFARVAQPLPQKGDVSICIRAPGPGTYTLSVIQDRNSNRKFEYGNEGAGFPRIGNLGRNKPKAADVAVSVGNSPQAVTVPMQYFSLFRLGLAKN